MAIPSSSSNVEPQQMQDMDQLEGDVQQGTSGVFEQENITVCSYNYISTATTTVVKASAGVLHSVVVQGGTAGTIIIYDNPSTSGTIIASFASTAALQSYVFDVAFTTGLTVITGNNTKLTVNYL